MFLNGIQDEKIENNNIHLMGKIKESLRWRLTNDYNWKHCLRTPLWINLAELFPTDFKPLGKIDTKIDNSVAELMTPVSVEFVAAFDTCVCSLGWHWHSYNLEYPLIISSPKNANKEEDYTLGDLVE